MVYQEIALPWGKEPVHMKLPETWRLMGVLEPSSLPGVADAGQEAQRSLAEPFGSPRLAELVKTGMKIAVVVDDGSRPTPVAKIFPALMKELQDGGAGPSQVTVVPALGVHRAMTSEELGERIGADWLAQVKWESPDCDDPEKLANLGTSRRGTPVLVNKTVAEADLVISIGCIEPHIIASFGGGYKNLFPGVAGRATIAHNHAINCQPDTFNNVGAPIEKNPMRLDLEECGRMLKPPVFIINAVLNSALEPVRVVSGDPIEAHRAGVKVSASIYGVQAPGLADIVITDSHPMDQDLRQGVKALANTIRAVRPGGTIITLVRADEGVGVFGLANRKLPVGRQMLKLLAPLLLPRVPKLNLKGMGEEDRFFLYFALHTMLRCDALLFAPTIPPEIHERLPFVRFAASPEAALEKTRAKYPGKADVLVFPFGGSTYPILSA
jgi:nickel-dependent lactate racemase